MIKNIIKLLPFVVTGIIIASFLETNTLLAINQFTYDVVNFLFNICQTVVNYSVEYFFGESNVK